VLVGLCTIVRVITVTNVLYCYWYIFYLHVVRGVFVVCRVTTRQTLSDSGRRPHRIAVATRVPQICQPTKREYTNNNKNLLFVLDRHVKEVWSVCRVYLAFRQSLVFTRSVTGSTIATTLYSSTHIYIAALLHNYLINSVLHSHHHYT
jgi:hypothetical protein